jgi:hypothetical protein
MPTQRHMPGLDAQQRVAGQALAAPTAGGYGRVFAGSRRVHVGPALSLRCFALYHTMLLTHTSSCYLYKTGIHAFVQRSVYST